MKLSLLGILGLLLFPISALSQERQQQFAALGDFKLESGKYIYDCRLGYRTFGRLNGDKSNVVLVPTWLAGTTSISGSFRIRTAGRCLDYSLSRSISE